MYVLEDSSPILSYTYVKAKSQNSVKCTYNAPKLPPQPSTPCGGRVISDSPGQKSHLYTLTWLICRPLIGFETPVPLTDTHTHTHTHHAYTQTHTTRAHTQRRAKSLDKQK